MQIVKLILRNLLRDKLRSLLTISGAAIAIVAFVLLRTFVTAWHSGAEAAGNNRLITRHAVSFMFSLPSSYQKEIEKIPGVTRVSHATWFGGVYRDQRHFFPRLAVDAESYFELHPEFVIPATDLEAFQRERNSCLIGAQLAKEYNLKIGDDLTLTGDLYPGEWKFAIRGIYRGKDLSTNEKIMFFQWNYLNERVKSETPEQAGLVGWYVVNIATSDKGADISTRIDALFENSPARTKTETEQAFRQGILSMSNTIIASLQVISYVIVAIIFLVFVNTMIMSAREKTLEYGVLRTLGFKNHHIAMLIAGEALLISILGGAIGLAIAVPFINNTLSRAFAQFLPTFYIEQCTLILAAAIPIAVGLLASAFPIYGAVRTRIVEALRRVE